MRIVILDGNTLNPGDLSWEGMRALGECVVHPRTLRQDVVERGGDAEVLITNKTPIDEVAMRSMPNLRYIGVTATGYNIVDVQCARAKNIVVANVPLYGTRSVAQHVFALLLELTQHVGHHAQTVDARRWTSSPDFCYWDYPLIELDGLTMGILGYGRIGQAVSRLATAFGLNVLAYSRTMKTPMPEGATTASLDELFSKSDALSLHCPLTDETKEIVDAARLATMKKTAFLINTSRGPLINEFDLANALNQGVIAGAGLDVLTTEPPTNDNPLFNARNCLITPHIAWATHAARKRLMSVSVENLRAFLVGKPTNVVS